MTVEQKATMSASNRFVEKLAAFVKTLEPDEQEVFKRTMSRGTDDDVSGYAQNDTITVNGTTFYWVCIPLGWGEQYCFWAWNS